jgi:RNA polymerase-interacting CarD/CdnL/TRCF family regulator
MHPDAVVVIAASGGYSEMVKLAVGDVVVYGMYGIGQVAAREKRTVLGVSGDVVVLELADELTVTLPLERARTQLRPLAGEEEIRRVQETLREDRALSVDPWLARRRDMVSKLSGGELVELAEIVGDGVHRTRTPRANGSKPQLSSEEKELFQKARKLLSAEISRARGLCQADADSWIDEQLAVAGAA